VSRLSRSPRPARPDPRREPDGPSAGDLVADRYRLEALVGKGGMGQVWAAFDSKLSRKVAVKIVDLDGVDPVASRSRFEREAELSRQLRGPSFVEVYDQGWADRRAYLVMELLEGETLHQRLTRVGVMSPEDALVVLRSVGACLRLAHTLQIVHRDLKPGNIFFAKAKSGQSGVQAVDGRAEIVKLLDFGIAKDAWDGARLTKPGVMLGSAFYMSPEQVRSGRDVDARADLWALSVILFRALTGERPFGGAAADALAKILAEAPPSPSALRPALGTSFDPFFEKALDKDPAWRFQSIDELLDGFLEAMHRQDHEAADAEADSALAALDRVGAPPPRPTLRAVPPPLPAPSEPPTVITPRSDELIPVVLEDAPLPPSTGQVEPNVAPRPLRRPRPALRLWQVGLLLLSLYVLVVAVGLLLAPR
jgi:serine/threonine-protein kinase